MSSDPLVYSFDVDKHTSTCAFPGKGQQAHIVLPPLYPDELSTFISKEEAKTFFKRLNKILQKTGIGSGFHCVNVLVAPVILLTLIFGDFLQRGESKTTFTVCLVIEGIFFWAFCIFAYSNKRKRKLKITEEVNSWNRNQGLERGIYFALGGENGTTGPSVDDFWRGIYPMRMKKSRNGGGLCDIELSNNLNPKIHLYVNPPVRREYCIRTGADFYIPSQYNPSQTPEAVAYNINNETSDDNFGQPLLQGGAGGWIQPHAPPPAFNPNFTPPTASEADVPPPSAPAFVFDLKDPPPSYDSIVKK